jgi:hypothetical protein
MYRVPLSVMAVLETWLLGDAVATFSTAVKAHFWLDV